MSVFITGASSGIGEACARAFAGAGHELILAARRVERLEALAADLRAKHSVKVHCFKLDVTRREMIDHLVAGNQEVFSRVEILVNNAGLARGRTEIQTGEPEDWDVMIDTNIKGLLYVSRALLPILIARGKGHVVNLGSVAGHWIYPQGNVYAATKFAVRALNESMRQDLAGTGVRVTEIAPGMVETEFSEVRFGGDQERARKVYERTTPLCAEDIAECVLWSTQRPAHVNIQEMIVYSTDQSSVTQVTRRPS
ncbi:MAG: SDR family oxidoreductase [Bdellovibrionota bacterium]